MTFVHPRIGVSTWSLHHRLTEENVALLDLPAEVAEHGLGKLEICHFHFPSTGDEYLAELKASVAESGVEFFTLLIDTGNITAADLTLRADDERTIAGWIDVAAKCGAQRVRISAGHAKPDPENVNLRVSATALGRLADRGKSNGIHVVTENWHELLDRPHEVIELLEMLEHRVGLKLDFGNWKGEGKYDDLARIAPFAECTHAKAFFPQPGIMDVEDFTRCLTICRDASFVGPHILIYDGKVDEWDNLDKMREVVSGYVES